MPADGPLGTVVLFLADGDVVELDPGCCDGGFFPIPTINARVTIRSSDPVVRAAAPAMLINAQPAGGVGVVMERLEFAGNSNACSGGAFCTLEVSAGVRLELFDVGLTTGSTDGIWVRGAAGAKVRLAVDGFEASGARPVVAGTWADVELRNGTITGIQAAELAGGSFLGEALVHAGAPGPAVGGLVDGTDLTELKLVGLDSDGASATTSGGLVRAVRSPVWLEDARVSGCSADGAGGLLDLSGDGQTATLYRVAVTDCRAGTGAAVVQATGYDVEIDRLDVSGADGRGAAALIDVNDGDLAWVRGEVCGATGGGNVGVRVGNGSLAVHNAAFREFFGIGTVFEQANPTGDGLLAQLTLDLDGDGVTQLLGGGGAVELFNAQLALDGGGLGQAQLVGRSGHNHLVGGFPAGWPQAEGDFGAAEPGWVAAYLDARDDCSVPGIPRVSESHPAWDGGYTTDEWHDPDCTPSDVGVFGGPDVDLERATWFGQDPCEGGVIGAGGDVFYGGGLAACGCGGGVAQPGWLLVVPWLRRRRR